MRASDVSIYMRSDLYELKNLSNWYLIYIIGTCNIGGTLCQNVPSEVE